MYEPIRNHGTMNVHLHPANFQFSISTTATLTMWETLNAAEQAEQITRVYTQSFRETKY